MTHFLDAMQGCLSFPYNNTIDGPPFERLVAISIASKMHLFLAGITDVRLLYLLQLRNCRSVA